MKIIARAVQASFTITADDGTEIMALSYENASFSCDLATGLKAISDLAHQFKALDATHNVDVAVNAQSARSQRERVQRVQPEGTLMIFGQKATAHQQGRYATLVETAHRLADLAAEMSEHDVVVAAKLVQSVDANDVGAFLEAARELNTALRYMERSVEVDVAVKEYRRARDLFTF